MSLIVFNDTATTEIYTLSLHGALPISLLGVGALFVAKVWLPSSTTGKDAAPGRPAPEAQVVVAAEALPYGTKLERKHLDRKSTRLNSSHANISYAVFCLNKKTRV